MKYQSVIFFHNDKEPATKEIIDILCLKLHETEDNFDKFNRIEVFTEENKLGISDVKDITEWNAMKSEEKIKLSVVRQAHKLTIDAQNAILKVVEEPNENTLIVLSTNNLDALLETIRSRCLVINYNQEIGVNLNQELVTQFFNGDFLKRSEIFDEISKENRAVIKEFIISMLQEIVKTNEYDSKTIDILKNAYIGIDMSTNTKLTLDAINIALLKKE